MANKEGEIGLALIDIITTTLYFINPYLQREAKMLSSLKSQIAWAYQIQIRPLSGLISLFCPIKM